MNKSPNNNTTVLNTNTIRNKGNNNTSNLKNNNVSDFKNNSRNNNSRGSSTLNILGIVILVIVIIFLGAVSYWAYNWYLNNDSYMQIQSTEILPSIKDATSTISINGGAIPTSKYSSEYAVSMWVKINDYSYKYGQEKIVLRRGQPGSGNPEISLAPNNNDLIVKVKYMDLPNKVVNNTISTTTTTIPPTPTTVPATTPEETAPAEGFTNPSSNELNYMDYMELGGKNIPNVNNEIGSNEINYATIKYNNLQECGCSNNYLPSQTITPDTEMNVIQPKEETVSTLPDNYKNSFFSMISGNNVTTSQKMEKFTSDTIISQQEMPDDEQYGVCIARNIPLQKWVCVIVSVYDQVVDIYLNGELTSSCAMKRPFQINTGSVDITPDGGFSGQIGRVAFYSSSMTVDMAKDVYYAGPIKSNTIFDNIPSWVYYIIIILIVIAIIYSVYM